MPMNYAVLRTDQKNIILDHREKCEDLVPKEIKKLCLF